MEQPLFLPNFTFTSVVFPFLALVLLFRFYSFQGHDPKEPPLYGKGEPDLKAALQKGYDQDIVFRIRQPHDEYVVIPHKFVDSLKNLPPEQLSLTDNVRDRLFDQGTKAMVPAHTVVAALKRDFPRQMDCMLPVMLEETKSAVDSTLGPCQEWTAHPALATVTQITLLARSRLFAGLKDNNQHKEFATLMNEYATDMMKGVETLWACPKVFRPFFGHIIPSLRALKHSEKRLISLIEPVWSEHLNSMSDTAPGLLAKDAVQWHLDRSDDREKRDLEFQVLCQILLTSAGTDALSITTYHTLCELAARPEYLAPLREEAENFFARVGHDGSPTTKSMTLLPKLDSFFKETLRHNPLEMTVMNRTVMTQRTLPDGTILKPGTNTCIAVYPASMDPNLFPSPTTFDGWRFVNLRSNQSDLTEGGNSRQWDAISPQLHSLQFGYGNRSCPGRFFAINLIKMIIAFIIVDFDIRNQGGEGVAGRPKNTLQDVRIQPDAKARFEFKKRER
ncbi:MAG: hypothetical protein Q9181_006092 [Wetmoreana brouardii]